MKDRQRAKPTAAAGGAATHAGGTMPAGLPARLRECWGWSTLGAVLVWLAQPPFALHWIAWVALVPWALLVARAAPLRRGGYLALWAAGSLLWLLTLQGVRLAHPALYPGWIVLGVYMGAYPPVFVGLARVMHLGWKLPLWISVPVVWTGLELVRSYAFTGFSIALLGHSQADVAAMIQIADTFGSYGVSFVLAMVSGAVAEGAVALWHRWTGRGEAMFRSVGLRSPAIGSAAAAAVVAATIAYGLWRLGQADRLASQPPLLEALLIQRNEPLVYSMDPNREVEVFNDYFRSTLEAVRRYPDAELVVWPESMYTGGLPLRILGESWNVPEGVEMERAEFEATIEDLQATYTARAAELQRMAAIAAGADRPPELLVGSSVYRYAEQPQAFGGAVHIDENHEVAGWYGKMHLVMFGEYIPFGAWLPWLYEIGPLRQGATPGEGPVRMEIAGAKIAPSICFETMVEQVTGEGLRQLDREGRRAELIINITNDAWFKGASILDHHRRCSQLVAVANRRPLLMAANQGPTVWIDGSGRRIESLPHETNSVLRARPTADGRWGIYQQLGDALSWPLALWCGVLTVSGLRRRRAVRWSAGCVG